MRLSSTTILLSKRNFCQLRKEILNLLLKKNNHNNFKELEKNNIRINKKKIKVESPKKRLETKSTIAKTIIHVNIYEKIIKYLARRLIVNVFKLLQSSLNLTNEKMY